MSSQAAVSSNTEEGEVEEVEGGWGWGGTVLTDSL